MWRRILVLLMLVVCCYCLESNDMVKEESRAKKKRSPIRLIALILLFVFSKVAIFKVASFFVFMAFFQKIFYMIGLVLSYFMRNQPLPIPPVPQPAYGVPQDYNTVGYNYGPPEPEPFPENGLPSIAEFRKSLSSWSSKP